MDGRLLLFDFDGVIADSLELYETTTRRCFELIGTPITPNREVFLDLFDDNFYDAIQARGVKIEEFIRAIREIGPSVDFSGVGLFAGIEPVLEELARENTLIVISSNTNHAVGTILSAHRCACCFQEIMGADVMVSKVRKIIHAMEKYRCPPVMSLFIGDTAGDIREARQAGIGTVAVTWGWHGRERLESADPDYIVDTPEELLALAALLTVR
ncbi:MAG: HAD family hydrolase [Deltaproteobacteria bacterium]|nr:HAD family hydrolase [Deltaproteobacteria bacterium]MBN2688621.1 HAD family hydrolase [Deltaproteobacteria bacterium]